MRASIPVPIGLALTAALAMAGPLPGQAAAHADTTPRVLHVTAQGTVQRTPDRAVVGLAVETLAPTAAEATAANAAAMDRVLAALARLGVPEARIRTTRIELRPQHERRRDGVPPAIVSYQAMNQVMVQLDDMERVGAVVDAAVQAGANRVTGITFQLRDPEAARHEALRLAVQRAGAEAAVLADALGEVLGPPVAVTTGAVRSPPAPFRAMAMEADVAAATPVQPGELDVQATVSITYRLGS